MKRILLYYPPNKRSVAIETLVKAVIDSGNELIVLTLTERGAFHEAVEKLGVKTFTHVLPRKPSWKYYWKQMRFLQKFCKEHRIDAVWSHLQEACMPAVLGQYFMKAKVLCFRHHAESAFYAEYGKQFNMQRNSNEVLFDKIINRLARKIIIPSSGVWYAMEKYEGCNMKKVLLVPYIYDFTDYDKPSQDAVDKIRQQNDCRLLLIMVSRMVPSKQHMAVYETVNKLVKEGLSIKMIVMDEGPLWDSLQQYVKDNGLTDHIQMVGFRSDFINYMAAAEMLVHPSLTEASNNVVKELGLMEKTVAVCRDVGDFNDYIEEKRNGFFIDRAHLKESMEEAIRYAYSNKEKLPAIGKELKADVFRLFSYTPGNRKRFIDLI